MPRPSVPLALTLLLSAAVLVAVSRFGAGEGAAQSVAAQGTGDLSMVEVQMPEVLSAQAQLGAQFYDAVCAACHGTNGAGQEGVAPPLIHIIYEPSHHGDEAFQRAVAYGVRAHHWPFGNMPPQEGLTRGDVAMIVAFIREVQRANGIN